MAASSLGDLALNLRANTGEFESNLGKAAHTAEREARRIEIASVAIGTAIADIGIKAAMHFYEGVKQAIAYRASLNDLAATTGESVTQLDALTRSAQISGVGFDRVESAVIRLSKSLNDAGDEGKKSARALETIGLAAESVRAMKPAEAMLEIARALDKFEDGAGKVAIAQALMGKEGAKLLPMMKDLAAEGLQQGKITAEQAAQAERLQKEWRRLSVEGGELGRTIANSVIPWVGDMIEQFREGKKIFGGFWAAAFGQGLGMTPVGSSAAALRQLEDYQQRLNEIRQLRGKDGLGRAQYGDLEDEERQVLKKIEFAKLRLRQLTTHMAGLNVVEDAAQPGKPGLAFLDAQKLAKDPKARKERDDAERIARQIAQAAEEEARTISEAWSFVDKQIRERDKRAAETAERIRKSNEEATALFAAALQDKTLWEAENLATRIETIAEDTKKADDIAKQLGLTFSSAFEDAVVGGKGFREILKGIEMDIARLILRKTITEPLAGAATDFLKESLRGVFGGARASGGPVSAGMAYLVGEGGPEMFVPPSSGTIVPNSGMGRSDVLNITFNVNSLDPRSAAQVIAANKDVIRGVIRQANAEAGRRSAF